MNDDLRVVVGSVKSGPPLLFYCQTHGHHPHEGPDFVHGGVGRSTCPECPACTKKGESMSDDLRQELAVQFNRDVDYVASALERMAAEIRSIGAEIIDVPAKRCPSASRLASRIVHEAVWGLANASLSHVMDSATEFDRQLGDSIDHSEDVPSGVSQETIDQAMSGMSESLQQALLDLIDAQERYRGDGRVPAKMFGAPASATALVRRDLASWGPRPNHGYRATALGRAVAAEVLKPLRAKLAEGVPVVEPEQEG